MDVQIILTQEPITPSLIDSSLPSQETGAVLTFEGIVRETEDEQKLDAIFYEAYEPMAEKELRKIFEDLGKKLHGQSVICIHRLGWVPVGEVSLHLRICTAHRKESLQICAESIDLLKRDVPIWKAEMRWV